MLEGSKESPVINPAFYIKNWNSNAARILVNGKEFSDYRIGINNELEGTDLVLFVFIKEVKPISITIIP